MKVNLKRYLHVKNLPILGLAAIWIGANGCASAPTQTTSEGQAKNKNYAEFQKLLANLDERIQNLETKLNAVNDKLDTTRLSLDKLTSKPSLPTDVISHPSENSGNAVVTAASPLDPENGFTHDEAVQDFRKAIIQFQSEKYSESILAFTDFTEKFPDHVLAGSAQYYVGEAYFKQRQYKLAVQEFQRVLTTYDRSPHVTDALKELAQAEEYLKQSKDAEKYRRLLTTLFPQSPANLNTPVIEPRPQIQPVVSNSSSDSKSESKSDSNPDSKLDPKTNSKLDSKLDATPSTPLTAPIEDTTKPSPASTEDLSH